MTGPEHYRAAERLLKKAVAGADASLLARAQVHATLAHAAATVDVAYGQMSVSSDDAWAAAMKETSA